MNGVTTHTRIWLAFAVMLAMPKAVALEATISAKYKGESSGRFTNTTPPASYCKQWPAECQNLEAVELPITYAKISTKGTADVRDQFYVKVPGPRQVDVYHEQSGESHRMPFEVTGFSQQVLWLVNRNPVFTAYVDGGCRYKRTFGYRETPGRVLYLWELRNPQAPSACFSVNDRAPAGYVATTPVSEMGIAYNLKMPPPYRMKPGTYRGSLTYSIGPGGDFDFGNDVTELNGNSLTLNFVLEVEHAFIFDFPPGSDRAVLEPPGGWQSWLSGARAPERLQRDLPFRLWSTGPFKVYKLCQYDLGSHCAIRNPDSQQAPVEVALSLPGGISHQNSAVNRVVLPTGRLNALQFEAVQAVLNRPGQLHFQVARNDVRGMLAHPGTTYTGHVTVVFDAEL
ncbi:hypothetical protein [Pseudomonas alkylphenolica]|uniref:hypothetical protein n=1 Tax=Pseudomonas alkylphenolica TaxID=237609 RepID=UPI0018D9E3A5|nr:hypothetical protein [Pseudomonas alkylphenolica]MBH3428830.1 hypothetical protein [Pseudomonas alkylphenolica]